MRFWVIGNLSVPDAHYALIVDPRLRLDFLAVGVLHFLDFTDRIRKLDDPGRGIPSG